MNTATKHLFAIVAIAGLFHTQSGYAQQRYWDKSQSAYSAPSKSYRVAQLPTEPGGDLTNTTVIPTPPPEKKADSTIATPDFRPKEPSSSDSTDSVPGTVFPGMVPQQEIEAEVDPNACFDNGLWTGCNAGSRCALCGRGSDCCPDLWYTEQGARVITRTRPRKTNLDFVPVTGFNSLGATIVVGSPVFHTKALSYDIAPGYQGTIGRYLGRDSSNRDDFLQFTYWGMNTWNDSQTYTNTSAASQVFASSTTATYSPLYSGFASTVTSMMGVSGSAPFHYLGFDGAFSSAVKVSSEMHNFELNFVTVPRGRPDQMVLHPDGRWRRECRPGTYMTYLAGFRYLTLEDNFDWLNQGSILINSTYYPIEGVYDVHSENRLFGAQIGVEMEFRQCKWSWGVRAKAGPYLNFSKSVQDVYNRTASQLMSYSEFIDQHWTKNAQQASLIGEVGFMANYRFKPNLIGNIGYDFTWITGLALAPEQVTFSPSAVPFVNTNGMIFAHGISANLEWTW